MFKLTDALSAVRYFNRQRVSTSLSFLPRKRNTPGEIVREVEEYGTALEYISRYQLDSDITVKPQQFGILRDPSLTLDALMILAERAKSLKNFVWVDMERSSTVTPTIQTFEKLYDHYGNVGICLQAYLRRTRDDLDRILERRAPVRLVKGFYNDSDITNWQEVTDNYRSLMYNLLNRSNRPCIATHDLELIEEAKKEIQDRGIQNAEIQFFKGVRDDFAVKLSQEGYKTRIYVPYGQIFRFLADGFKTFDISRHLKRFCRWKKII